MLLQVSCDLAFDIAVPTPFILMLRPRLDMNQRVIHEGYSLTPTTPMAEFIDSAGNRCQRLVAPPGQFSLQTWARVEVADVAETQPGAPFIPVPDLPDRVLDYLLPSRYCESDRFGQMAAEITAGRTPGYDQVAAIEEWLRANVRFVPGSSEIPLSAVDVNLNQQGVCRDLAHLGIALCRGLTIPARLVVGYLHELEPMELHAWFEAYVGGQWYRFDATQREPKAGYVVTGYGRDATDVAVYNQFGPPVFPLQQLVSVERIEESSSPDRV